MGTTKIKIIDLSAENQTVKASQKHAQSQKSANKIKKEKSQEREKDHVILGSGATPESGQEDSGQARMTETGIASSQAPRNDEENIEGKPAEKKAAQVKKTKGSKKESRRHLGTKYIAAKTKIEKEKVYPAAEAFTLLSETSYTKFDPTVEIHFSVNAKSVRGTVNFPHATGPKKEKKYLVFTDKKDDSLKNVIWASTEDIAEIQSGKLKPGRDFNAVIASPKFMPQLASVAKILGPAGMMPNPKSGTVTENPKSAIEDSSTSGVEYRTDPQAPIIHTKIGKLSEKPENLKENLKALVVAIGPQKIKKATLTSTMGPGIKLDVLSL
ncbi:MAG: hypothetical protein WD988_00635 [Candidatus Curtissbacteria bacterium]